MLTIWPSGSHYCYRGKCGIFFWGANGHDAVWHLALVSFTFSKWPFLMPVYSGAYLNGYNFLMDLVIYLLTFIKIPTIFSYFKLIPFIWFFVFTGLLIYLGRKIIDSIWFIFWLLFFSYFGSSFGYLFTLYHQKTIWGSASLLSMQSGQNLTNMQFSISLIILLVIMLLVKKENLKIKNVVFLSILVFFNFGIKFYGGLISLFFVSFYYLLYYFFPKKLHTKLSLISLIKTYFIIGIFAIAAIFIFYNPFTSLKSGSTFIFSPFATMHSMIEEPINFYLKDMVNARYYLYENASLLTSPRLLFIELFSSAIFLFFSNGLRVLGLIYLFWKIIKKRINKFEILISSSMLLSYLFLLFFIQKGIWWNIVQFYYFFLFLLNFFTAEFFYQITKKANKIIIILVLFIAITLTLPGNLDILKSFLVYPAPSYLPDYEVPALNYLKNKPKGIVYASLFNKSLPKDHLLNPLYLSEDSSYITAFGFKQLYFADFDVLDITNIDYKGRVERIRNKDCSVLDEVDYIYEIKERRDDLLNVCLPKQKTYSRIYQSSRINIYEKKK